jgi:hypothetical protein
VLFAGEPGIGKTTLAGEVARAAGERGFVTIWARCWEDGGAPAYWPFIQVLRALVRELPDRMRAELDRAPVRSAALARLVPELATTVSPAPATERFALFDATASLLRDVAAERPVLVVLDDLHAVDPSSLSMLTFLVRELKTARVAFVGTYRDLALDDAPDVRDLLARVAREGSVVRLPRLARADVVRIIEAAAGVAAPAIVELVYQTSEGVPLFVDELLHALSKPGSALLTGAPIPTGVRAAIKDRVSRLDAETRGQLEIASVVGPTFTLALASSIGEAGPERVHELVERAAAAGVLERRAPGRYAFAHGLVREALYREIQGGRRARLHAAIVETIEKGVAEASPTEHAYHALKAAPVIGVARAVAAARAAATAAVKVEAFEGAVELLKRALAVMDVAPADAALRAAVVGDLAAVEERAGRGQRTSPRTTAPRAPRRLELTRDGELWTVRYGDLVTRLRESRGLGMLQQLVTQPGLEIHALTLCAAPGANIVAGDAGDVLDREAIDAYRARVSDVEDELREAEAWNDPARAERARAEIELLRGELSRAVGLGGRMRRAGSDAERARINAQRRLRDAIRRIAEQEPDIGRHLERAVRTGTFCSYVPPPLD